MSITPAWQAARNGPPGDLDATNHAAQVAQELGAHAITAIYQGNQLLSTLSNTNNAADGQFFWIDTTLPEGNLLVNDLDQSFVMPAGATSIGRVTIACRAIGAGADIQLTLYPDNAGNPDTTSPIASVTVPREQIANLGAPDGLSSGGPLATAEFNSFLTGQDFALNWVPPADGAGGAGNNSSLAVSGNRFIFLGGTDNAATVASSNVATATFLGGGNLSNPTPQPSLPQATYNGMATATPETVAFMGGQSGPTTVYSNVWTASWDPLTNVVGSWTAQTALPTKVCQGASASWNNTVYVIGGTPDGTVAGATTNVYYADATNGQIRTWTSAPPLPAPLTLALASVVGDWLIVAGGRATTSSVVSTVYFAAIQPDGSLGGWQTGPTLPLAIRSYAPGWDQATTDSAFLIVGGMTASVSSPSIQCITATSGGLATEWEWRQNSFGVGAVQCGVFSDGNPGEYTLFSIQPLSTQYNYMAVEPAPMISAPLHATGLTAGATYHLTVHQTNGDPNNNVQIGECTNPASWTYRPAYTTGAWTPHTDHALTINLYDTATIGNLIHTWEDPDVSGFAAATSTHVFDGTGRLLGICDQVSTSNEPLNINPTFTSGVSPWTAVNGTITQSSAHTQGGFPFSGLLTPTGGFSLAQTLSELVPLNVRTVASGVQAWMIPTGWCYSPAGWATFALAVNWYDSARAYLSTSSSTIALPAATWTNVTNAFQIPAGAAYATLAPTLSGTPTATDVVYLSDVTLTYATGTTRPLSTVTAVDYDPSGWIPTGTTQL